MDNAKRAVSSAALIRKCLNNEQVIKDRSIGE
jgi:hypothetical protein